VVGMECPISAEKGHQAPVEKRVAAKKGGCKFSIIARTEKGGSCARLQPAGKIGIEGDGEKTSSNEKTYKKENFGPCNRLKGGEMGPCGETLLKTFCPRFSLKVSGIWKGS